jgi:hypothetical protein
MSKTSFFLQNIRPQLLEKVWHEEDATLDKITSTRWCCYLEDVSSGKRRNYNTGLSAFSTIAIFFFYS